MGLNLFLFLHSVGPRGFQIFVGYCLMESARGYAKVKEEGVKQWLRKSTE